MLALNVWTDLSFYIQKGFEISNTATVTSTQVDVLVSTRALFELQGRVCKIVTSQDVPCVSCYSFFCCLIQRETCKLVIFHNLIYNRSLSDITRFSPVLGHCPSWVAGYTHQDAASFNSLALTFSLMFASDSICLSTYSNVSCDCWGKAWRPNVALFSYNSNEVQSDKNPNSFNCWPRSGCPYCPSALVSVSACRYAPHFSTSASARTSRAGQGSCHVLVFWSVTFFTCPPASSPTMFTLSIHRSDSSQTKWNLALWITSSHLCQLWVKRENMAIEIQLAWATIHHQFRQTVTANIHLGRLTVPNKR